MKTEHILQFIFLAIILCFSILLEQPAYRVRGVAFVGAMVFSAIIIKDYGYYPFTRAYALLFWLPYWASIPMVPIRSSNLFVLFPISLFFLSLIQSKKSLKPFSLSFPMVMFLLGGMLSLIMSSQYPSPYVNPKVQFMGNCMVPICFFILLRLSIRESKQLHAVLACLAIGAVLVSLMPLFLTPMPGEHFIEVGAGAGAGQRFGGWFHYAFPLSRLGISVCPTDVAFILSGAIPLLFGLILVKKVFLVRLAFFVLFLMACGTLLISGGRAGLIGASAGILTIALFSKVRSNAWIILMIPLVIVIYLFSVIQSTPFLYDNEFFRIKCLMDRFYSIVHFSVEETIPLRLWSWGVGLSEILTHPLGVGFRDTLFVVGSGGYPRAAHNVLINVGQGTGLLGLTGFIIIIIRQFVWLFRSVVAGEEGEKPLRLVLLGTLLAYFLCALTMDPTRLIYPFQMLWIILAVIEVVIFLDRKQRIYHD